MRIPSEATLFNQTEAMAMKAEVDRLSSRRSRATALARVRL
jgi:hypothetical protein